MAVIRSDEHVSDGAGAHQDHSISYAGVHEVFAAMEELRALNEVYGYYYRTADGEETYNLGLDPAAVSPRTVADNVPTGVARAFAVTTRDAPALNPGRDTLPFAVRWRQQGDEKELLRLTNSSAATMNAMAIVLARGAADQAGNAIPRLTDGWLPKRFADYWNIAVADIAEVDAADKQELWGQGAARAVQAFNLGAQVDPLKMLRGDVLQLGSRADVAHRGHAAYCFAARRIEAGEVRFLLLASQPETFGVGVPLNELAQRGALLEGAPMGVPTRHLKVRLIDADGEALKNHRYQLQLGTLIKQGKSDEDGRIEVRVPAYVPTGELSFWLPDEDGEEERISWRVRLAEAQGSGDGEQQTADAGPAGKARIEFVVSDSNQPAQRFVYHPGELWSQTFVTHAHRYGIWQVLRAGEGQKHQCFAPWRGHTHVGRLYAPFPCAPLTLGGRRDVAWAPAEGAPAAAGRRAHALYRNTEALPGGWFPLGRSRVWHSGVHLEPDEEGTVYAPFDGRVVAARLCDPALADDAGEPRFPYGSGNFVLLKHAVEVEGTQHEFFSLLMHLADPGLRLTEDNRLLSPGAARFPWLRELALAPDADAEKEEAADLDWKKLYLKVFRAPQAEVKLGDKPIQAGDILEVGDAAVTEAQWETYHGARGQAKRVSDGAEGEFDPLAFVEAGGLVAPYDAYPLKHVEQKEKLLAGEVVDLWEEELIVRAGEPLGDVGEWHGARRLHFEVFSKDFIPMKVPGEPDAQGVPQMTAKDAVDVDTAADPKPFFDRKTCLDTFFDGVEQRGNEAQGLDGEDVGLRVRARMLGNTVRPDDHSVLREDELRRFMNEGRNSLLPLFRELVVRHLSEWGDALGWDQLAQNATGFSQTLQPQLEEIGKLSAKYAWWTSGLGEAAGLPQDQVAHFYHPVTFLLWLDYERQQEVAKGQADALHKSVLDLNHEVGAEGGAPAAQKDTKTLRLRLQDEDGDALEGNRYELKVMGQTYTGESGAGGVIQHEIPRDATEGELVFWLEDDEEESHTWPLKIS